MIDVGSFFPVRANIHGSLIQGLIRILCAAAQVKMHTYICGPIFELLSMFSNVLKRSILLKFKRAQDINHLMKEP